MKKTAFLRLLGAMVIVPLFCATALPATAQDVPDKAPVAPVTEPIAATEPEKISITLDWSQFTLVDPQLGLYSAHADTPFGPVALMIQRKNWVPPGSIAKTGEGNNSPNGNSPNGNSLQASGAEGTPLPASVPPVSAPNVPTTTGTANKTPLVSARNFMGIHALGELTTLAAMPTPEAIERIRVSNAWPNRSSDLSDAEFKRLIGAARPLPADDPLLRDWHFALGGHTGSFVADGETYGVTLYPGGLGALMLPDKTRAMFRYDNSNVSKNRGVSIAPLASFH